MQKSGAGKEKPGVGNLTVSYTRKTSMKSGFFALRCRKCRKFAAF
jgi:hypothetical protein